MVFAAVIIFSNHVAARWGLALKAESANCERSGNVKWKKDAEYDDLDCAERGVFA